jgi:alkaline phosphatase D
VPVTEIDNIPGPEGTYSMDRWDGYVAARRRLLEFMRDRASNVVVLTGDIHANWVADLKPDFADTGAGAVATEFIGTSLSSGGDGADTSDFGTRGLAANPHIRFFNGQRGYVVCDVARDLWTAHYRVVEFVSRPGAPISTRASFAVERGKAGAQIA